ncbi:MAG TPA: toxin TcdB middle/N-terminal domain-containing protein, partial [Chloroflexota bacterium]|nr:toxin TcdB middle/N-terminal domain-containing protein [Chloroflexota bacterium]
VLLSTGTSFIDGGAWLTSSAYGAFGSDGYSRRYPMDVNGDGKTDMVIGPDASGNWYVLRSTGNSFHDDGAWATGLYASYGNDQYGRRYPMDADGDGKLDIVIGPDASGNWSVVQSPYGAADLVATEKNGMGGSSTITYRPSSAYSNANNPPIAQTVSQISNSDGRGNDFLTTYNYSGGLWDLTGHQFLGFNYSTRTLPCISGESACPYEETWFAQDLASLSKPLTYRRNAAGGVLLVEKDYQYATNGSAPYQSLETGVWAYAFDGSVNVCNSWPSTPGTGTTCPYGSRTYVAHAYDNYDPSSGTWSAGYGNIVSEYNYGNYDIAGDEVTAFYWYLPNTSAFITNKQAAILTYSGIGTGGSLLSEGLFYYDYASSWDVEPWAGKPTSGLKWLDTDDSFITVSATYDYYGNVTSETDETGATTTYTIDPTYNQFVTQTTNALGQVTSATWDPQCAVRSTATDLNGQTSSMTFDQMCRLTYTSAPLGSFEQRQYINVGDPNNSYVEVDTPAADGSGNQWARTYYDGLGRPYLTTHKGPSSGVTLSQNTVYNARGSVAQVSAPYATGEPPQYETRSYDQMDRVTRVTHADASYVSKSYAFCNGSACVTTIDELGHQQRDGTDAAGRPSWHDEWFGDSVQTRSYSYDARGQLSTITDGVGNWWYFWFDSLGRKVWISDPDVGYWSYRYDGAGRLIDQIDSIGNETIFEYDSLGRRVFRSAYDTTGQATTASWTYDEPASGYSNIGRLTESSNAS